MTVSVSIHELAALELADAVNYYESRISGLGRSFLDEIERAVKEITDQPEAAPVIYKFVRRKLLRRFPYSLMYSLTGDTIRILCVANQKRRPSYWYRRV
jgi:plasmid stabilization system protein ParE